MVIAIKGEIDREGQIEITGRLEKKRREEGG